jgi:acetyl esterase
MAAKLKAAGVKVDLEVFPGVVHGFMRAMATVGKARDAVEKAGVWLRQTR